MKIFTKLAIFVGSGLIIIGLIVTILAFVFGGRVSNVFQGERTDIDQSYQGVEQIVIDYRAGEIEIVQGDEFKIMANNVSKNGFQSKVENSIWTISDKKDSAFWFFTDINFHNDDTKVTIYIPKDAKLKACNFEIGAGKITADKINTEKFDVKVGAGEVNVSDLVCIDSNFDCGVGEIEITGEITGNSQIKCGVGKIGLNLKGDPDAYNYSVKVGIGHTQINGDSYSGVSDKKITNNDAKSQFTLDCGVGEINIQIKQ